ncbi:glutathione S-transferase [Aspergillus pseudoustus]|uniref:Glutathione S-transferase n=1 Tax=Aspergillus pseudoustus TaxID=1810923 RepID=A0ABR4J7X9_9EURO
MASEGRPVLHYLDIGSLGRGEVIRLFLQDAGIDFEDKRYPFNDTWQATSKELQEKGISKTGKVPVLEYKGVLLAQHIPILRYLSRDLGAYDGTTNLEKYTVDAVADLYIDWRAEWASNLSKVSDGYKSKFLPDYYTVLSEYYGRSDGPFLLGDRISYADFAVYQSIDNDAGIGALPEFLPEQIVKFKKAFEERPLVAQYLQSGRKTSA